ncbi:MAG TPA: wax ester/triacylglycerol synthase family O-acyltransferase [Micromonosporaceae bacterium]|nr:wax ester/triacylglycerol synthase family O-acyltransferase [Micromonosporaceae bacterium]
MERLTAEDQLMLWPDAIWPQDIGALAVLDGAGLLAPDGRFRTEAVRRVIEARLHLVPRFRQLLHVPRRGMGRPLWVDAPAFDLADHLLVAPLPAPGGETALLHATEQVRRRRLDRSRPLWEMWFFPGLAEGRVGMFVRMHHAIADGIAGVATVAALLDATPDTPAPLARPWTPAPAPAARQLLADNLRRHGGALGHALSALTSPVATARRLQAAWPAMRAVFDEVPTPTSSLDRPVGPNRSLALIRSSLDQVRQIGYAHDAKVNDVLLAVVAAGLRGLLRSRGERTDDLVLPVYVPVTLRQAQLRARARGNLIGQMIVPLPLGTADPGRRLREIAAETAERKARAHPPLGTVLRSRTARWALLRTLERHPVSVTTANLPGPQQPVYLAGARLLEVFPVLPLIAKVSLGVGALSYAGQLNITAIADRDASPDLEVFAAGVRAELRALTASTSLGPGRRTAAGAGEVGQPR